MMKQKSIKKNATLNILKTIFSLVFPLITYPYALRVLQTEMIGKYEFSVSIVSYFTLIAGLGVSAYAVREGSKYRQNPEKLTLFVSEIFSINLYSTVAAYVLLTACVLSINKFRPYGTLIAIISTEMMLTTMSVTWIYTIFEDFSYVTKISFFCQCVSVILLFLLVKESNDLYIYAIITVISSSAAGIFMFFHARRYVTFRFIARPSMVHLKPIIIVFWTTVASTIYISSDTTILGWMAGDVSVGLYSTAAKIYKIVKQVLNAAVAVFIPRFAFYIGKGRLEEVNILANRLFDYMIWLCAPAMVGLCCLSKPIIEVFAGKEYSSSYSALALLSIALAFAVFANICANGILISFGKERNVMIATFISAAINIVLNLLLIPWFRENAAAFTTIIAEACICFITMSTAKKCIEIKVNYRNVFAVMCGSVTVGICCMVIMHRIQDSLLRIMICVPSAIVLYILVQMLLKNSVMLEMVDMLRVKLRNKNGSNR